MKLGTITLTGGLSLAPLRAGDATELFALTDASRRSLRAWLPWVDSTKSPSDTRNFIMFAVGQHVEGKAAHFAIRRRRRIIGVVGFHAINKTNRKAEVGYWLGTDHLGNGVMTRCCRALIGWGFSKLKLNRIEIRVASKNRKSRAIPRRLGLRKEGILRQAECLNGKFVDHVVYSVLREEWTEQGGGRPR